MKKANLSKDKQLPKPRVAIGLFGISYKDNYKHWVSNPGIKNFIFKIDFRKSVHNYFARLINPIKKSGYEIDFFGSTYKTKNFNLDDYKNEYPFRDLYFMEPAEEKTYKDITELRNAHYLKVLNSILNSNQKYDYIVLTRWDLFFLKSFDTLNIKYDKINLTHKVMVKNWVDDNFYVIPGKYLKEYRDFIEKWNQAASKSQIDWKKQNYYNRGVKSHHAIMAELHIPIHYMESGRINVSDSPIYNIVRGKLKFPIVRDQVDWWGLGDNKDFPRFIKEMSSYNRVGIKWEKIFDSDNISHKNIH